MGSVVWANDNQTVFYTQEDEVSKRQYRLYRHTVGSTDPDILVYEEPDARFNVEACKTRSQAYIFLVSKSHTSSEARFIPATSPTANGRWSNRASRAWNIIPTTTAASSIFA